MDDEEEEISDAEFLEWAGENPQRWALLTAERRDAWVDHLVARIQVTSDDHERGAYWRLAYVIASADKPRPAALAEA